MTLSSYGRAVTTTAMLFLIALFLSARAHADTVWAGDISISNVNGLLTPKGADIAHVSLVISNAGAERDALIAVDVSPAIASAAGFDALPVRVYRGASLRRSQPVFLGAGQTRLMRLENVHLVLYGIQGPFERGMQFPVRLTFQEAGSVIVVVDVGGQSFEMVSSDSTGNEPTLQQIKPTRVHIDEPTSGTEFRGTDGSKLVLSFVGEESGISALIWLHGDRYKLPNQPPEPGPVQIVWSDGDHSLTWSLGVQLKWVNGPTHLMCGRGDHHQ